MPSWRNPALQSFHRLTVPWLAVKGDHSRSSPQDKNGANIFNRGNDTGWKEKKRGEWPKQKTAQKTELIVDNNLLWRSKAYSFGHFVCNLCGDTAHVEDTCGPFSQPRLLLITARDLHLHYSLPVWKYWEEKDVLFMQYCPKAFSFLTKSTLTCNTDLHRL